MEKYLEKLIESIVVYGPKLIAALAILVIGFMIIKVFMKKTKKLMEKRELNPSLRPFLISLISTTLKALLVISALSLAGIEMTSFVAILAAAGLAIGMALSGTLQNFAGGVMILIFKPFKVGDFIDAQGHKGTVKEIQIFNTLLTTPDNCVIIIPNGGLSNSSLTNFSAQSQRRVDWTFGIAYGDDSDVARETITELIKADSRILQDPAFFIGISELADSSVNFAVRAWVKSADYWGVFFDMNEKVYKTFEKKNLHIPFPQMDIHLQNQS